LALGVVACLGLATLPTGAAVADDSATLVQAMVYKAGGATATDSVTPAALRAAPSQCPAYPGVSMQEYGRQGPVTQTLPAGSTWTMATILGCLQTPIALADVTGVTVIGPSGAPLSGAGSQLTPADLATPSDFQNTGETPVLSAIGSTDQYDRPWRGGSDLDYLDETQSTPIVIEVFEGPPLKVTASASQATVTLGSTITFDAAVTGNNGSPLTYTWTFGGGAPNSAQAAPQVQFTSAGVWTVNVEVTDADGGGGGDQLTVTVKQPDSTTTPTTGTHTTGPDKSSGPTPGAAPRKQKKSGTQNRGTKHTHGKGSQTTTTTQTTTTQTTSTPATGGSSGSAGGGSAAITNPPEQTTTARAKPPAPTHRPSPRTPPPSSGTVVRGELVSDIIPLPADRSPLVHLVAASAGGAPARETPAGRSVLPIASAVLAILILLGLGAQRELGRPRWLSIPRIGH
jgi:hypothetical protein